MRELKKGDLVKIIRNCTINGSIGVVIEYRHYQPNREWKKGDLVRVDIEKYPLYTLCPLRTTSARRFVSLALLLNKSLDLGAWRVYVLGTNQVEYFYEKDLVALDESSPYE